LLIFLFVLVTTGILMFFGWCAARGGISYRSVRVMMFPATFFAGNGNNDIHLRGMDTCVMSWQH